MGKPVGSRVSKVHFGIVFTICTNQFNLPVTGIKDKSQM